MKTWAVRIGAVLVLVVLGTAELWAQCAMCRGSVESTMGNGRNNVGIGLNFGIAYLFVIPYLTVGIIAYLWYRNSRRQQRERSLVLSRVRDAMSGE